MEKYNGQIGGKYYRHESVGKTIAFNIRKIDQANYENNEAKKTKAVFGNFIEKIMHSIFYKIGKYTNIKEKCPHCINIFPFGECVYSMSIHNNEYVSFVTNVCEKCAGVHAFPGTGTESSNKKWIEYGNENTAFITENGLHKMPIYVDELGFDKSEWEIPTHRALFSTEQKLAYKADLEILKQTLHCKIPYDKIDAGIINLVKDLTDNGFITRSSCEGGEGHSFALPTVVVKSFGSLPKTRKRLATYMQSCKIPCTISENYLYQTTSELLDSNFIEITIWSKDSLK